MASTLDDLFSDIPQIEIPPLEEWPPVNPDTLWVNYDAETDDLVIYFADDAKRGIHVHVRMGYYVVVHPLTHVPLGVHYENWERDFVSKDAGIVQMWQEIKQLSYPQESWSQSLRAFGATVSLKMQYLDRTHQKSPLLGMAA